MRRPMLHCLFCRTAPANLNVFLVVWEMGEQVGRLDFCTPAHRAAWVAGTPLPPDDT